MLFRSVQKVSRLNSQSKYHMFTLFAVRLLEKQRGPSTWRRHHTKLYNFTRNISMNIPTLGQRTHLKLGELSSWFIVYNITISWLIHCMVFDFIFYCVTMHSWMHTLLLLSFFIGPSLLRRRILVPRAHDPSGLRQEIESSGSNHFRHAP